MAVQASAVPGARPPVLAFFAGRVLLWTGLVVACALPALVLTWPQFTANERLGEVLGVGVWAIVMTVVGTSRNAGRRSPMLAAGALVTALVYAALAWFAGPLGLLIWFGPTVWLGSHLPLVRLIESGFGNALWWTLACGTQSAVVAWLAGRAIDRVRRLGG